MYIYINNNKNNGYLGIDIKVWIIGIIMGKYFK